MDQEPFGGPRLRKHTNRSLSSTSHSSSANSVIPRLPRIPTSVTGSPQTPERISPRSPPSPSAVVLEAVAQDNSNVVVVIVVDRVSVVIRSDGVRIGYVLWVWLWVRLRILLWIRLWIWLKVWLRVWLRVRYRDVRRRDLRRIERRRPVRWFAVLVGRVPGRAPRGYRPEWIELMRCCHWTITRSVVIAAVVVVVGLVVD